eukprot:gnl/TRDRNA2_/TRDRNA2_169909_c0_seq1.p1 gnl/TRDRNA2_/TRDRNA2_169909_c0~~gnl/TRDRNA2_/TRDRNA2_169909_c0_seq1.p1  ORF type:complete len:212 (+),score=13.66 gnl/TRDRNA2_/TRDRNA2_169909_c0_seq1:59-637(+)
MRAAGLSRVLLAGCSAILCRHALAHECVDGSRISCIPVVSRDGPFYCTPDGRQVHCAVGHPHHDDCGLNEAPCCSDGSVPQNMRQGGPYTVDATEGACAGRAATSTSVPATTVSTTTPMQSEKTISSTMQSEKTGSTTVSTTGTTSEALSTSEMDHLDDEIFSAHANSCISAAPALLVVFMVSGCALYHSAF